MAAQKERASEKKLAEIRADLDATGQKLAQAEAALQVRRTLNKTVAWASTQFREHHDQDSCMCRMVHSHQMSALINKVHKEEHWVHALDVLEYACHLSHWDSCIADRPAALCRLRGQSMTGWQWRTRAWGTNTRPSQTCARSWRSRGRPRLSWQASWALRRMRSSRSAAASGRS